MSSRNRTARASEQVFRLFVGGLPSDANEKDLYEHFLHFGELLDVHISRTPEGRSKLFGYVQFASNSQAVAAMSAPTPHMIKKKLVNVNVAIPREEVQVEQSLRARRSLILKNIPLAATKQQIRSLVAEFGEIEQFSKLRRSNPQSMFCYVTLQKVEDALRLLNQGYLLFETTRKIYIEKFIPKSLRSRIIKGPETTTNSSELFNEDVSFISGRRLDSDQGVVGGINSHTPMRHHQLMSIKKREADLITLEMESPSIRIRSSLIIENRRVILEYPKSWTNQSKYFSEAEFHSGSSISSMQQPRSRRIADEVIDENLVFNVRVGSQKFPLNSFI